MPQFTQSRLSERSPPYREFNFEAKRASLVRKGEKREVGKSGPGPQTQVRGKREISGCKFGNKRKGTNNNLLMERGKPGLRESGPKALKKNQIVERGGKTNYRTGEPFQ